MLWSNEDQVPQLLSPLSRAQELQLLSSCAVTAEALAPQRPCISAKSSPHSPQLEKSPHSNKDSAQSKQSHEIDKSLKIKKKIKE